MSEIQYGVCVFKAKDDIKLMEVGYNVHAATSARYRFQI